MSENIDHIFSGLAALLSGADGLASGAITITFTAL